MRNLIILLLCGCLLIACESNPITPSANTNLTKGNLSYTGVKDHAQNQNPYRSVFIGEFDVAKRPTTLSNPRWNGHDLKKSFINPQLKQLITSGIDIQKGLSELAANLDEQLSQPIDINQ